MAEPSRVEDARPPPETGWETLTTPAGQRLFSRLYWACVDLQIPTPVVGDSIDAVIERIAASRAAQHDELEAEMIRLALAGDTNEARDALARCAEGLQLGTLSERMRQYLHDRLRDVVAGGDPAAALRIKRPPSRPRDPFPEWEMPLAAFAALLELRGRDAETIIDAMDEARQIIEGKGLSRTQAQRIRSTYKPMHAMGTDTLRHVMLHRPPRQGESRSLDAVPRFLQATAQALLALLDRAGPE